MEIATMKPRSHYVSTSNSLSTNNVITTAPAYSSPTQPQSHQILTSVEQHSLSTVMSSPSSDSERVVPIKNRAFYGQQIQPFQGRNLCLERNLVQVHQADQSNDEKPIRKHPLANGNQLITASSHRDSYYEKDYEVLVEELLNKNKSSSSEAPRSEILPKRHNLDRKGTRWASVRDIFSKKFARRHQESLVSPTNKNIHLNMMATNDLAAIEIKPNNIQRPNNLDISPIVVSRSSKTFKTPPHDQTSESFAVVNEQSKIVTSKSANVISSSDESSEGKQLKRQQSLEVFRDVFGPTKGSVARLRDVSQRIKTPGDVPASVRKIRASKTLSLYDDRMMSSTQSFDGLSNSM